MEWHSEPINSLSIHARLFLKSKGLAGVRPRLGHRYRCLRQQAACNSLEVCNKLPCDFGKSYAGEIRVVLEGKAAQSLARFAGALWLAVIIAGIFAEMYVRGHLLVRNDGAATTSLILQHQILFRLGVVSDITATACYLAVIALLYRLLLPVGRALSTVAAAFGIAGSAMSGLNMLTYFAPLVLLTNADHLVGFTSQQLHSIVLMQVKLYGYGENISLFFFSGVYLTLVGFLIFRSRFLPSVLGILSTLAGGCYLVGSVSSFIDDGLARSLGVFIYLPGGVAELSLAIWLVVRGVNPKRWHEASTGIDRP